MARKPKQNDEELIREIDQQFRFSKKYLDPVHESFNDREELYRCYIDSANYQHKAMVFDPRVFRVIETVTPRMVADEPQGAFYPVEEGDEITAHILNALIKYDWRRADMFPKLVKFVKCMLMFGTAFGRTFWDYRESEKMRMIPKQAGGKVIWTPKNTEMVKVTDFDGPNFEVLNIYDCFPDPNATDLENMRWFIYRQFKTIDELKAMNESKGGTYYKNLDKLEAMIDEKKEDKRKGSVPSDMEYREHRRTMLSTDDLTGQDESRPELVIMRRFERDRWVDYVPDYKLIIRDVPNPYFHGDLPIIYGVDYPYPGELYGMGEIEPVERIQRAINAVLNQRLDNVQLTLNTMWKVNKNSQTDLHTLYSAPGNIIMTGDMDGVEPIQVPDVTGPTFVQTMNYLTAAMQNGSGITDYTVGINTSTNTANETATGTRLIQQEANAQFKLKIQLFAHMVVQRTANHWKNLRMQYTTEEQKVRIVGKQDVSYLTDKAGLNAMDLQGQPIAPGELDRQSKLEVYDDGNFAFLNLLPEDIQPAIKGDYDFIAKVSSETLTDPMILRENFFNALDRVSNPAWTQGLTAQGKMLDYEKLTNKVFEKLEIGMDGKEVLADAPQAPAMPGQPGPSQPLGPDQLQQMVGQSQQMAEANQPLNMISNELYGQNPPAGVR
jgi:hypothetical protein